jgi:hypothetical protein
MLKRRFKTLLILMLLLSGCGSASGANGSPVNSASATEVHYAGHFEDAEYGVTFMTDKENGEILSFAIDCPEGRFEGDLNRKTVKTTSFNSDEFPEYSEEIFWGKAQDGSEVPLKVQSNWDGHLLYKMYIYSFEEPYPGSVSITQNDLDARKLYREETEQMWGVQNDGILYQIFIPSGETTTMIEIMDTGEWTMRKSSATSAGLEFSYYEMNFSREGYITRYKEQDPRNLEVYAVERSYDSEGRRAHSIEIDVETREKTESFYREGKLIADIVYADYSSTEVKKETEY